ncbi:cellulase-like family protein [Erythrobacter sp. F6033]|uniref:cellulase-like family protein n=1 Tax=Erythrobacter sp. F6033 TaxID=2926401 RepID=UPI001FF2D320|nr:cellulase-like family protein [Erythrobacter sp. F6033]MCK0127525.1 hypothetical protein [Erythrobacter sp. F6033]
MWDFSWLERRWPGAGYENWDQALDELVERGYDAIRIDVYPHLIDANPMKTWRLKPVWHVQDWGAPGLVDVQVLPALIEFLSKCQQRDIKLGISSWFREDLDNVRLQITDGEALARIWKSTLDHINAAGLLDSVLYVDVCNEWPGPLWAPFMQPELQWGEFHAPRAEHFMRRAFATLRADYPEIPFLFSTNNSDIQDYARHDLSYLDAIDHHEWMVNENGNEFYNIIGYEYQRFSQDDYIEMQQLAASTYAARPEYWDTLLREEIAELADISRNTGKPMIITECWAIVDYKDWPLLPWDWVKDVCSVGTLSAAATGRWLVNATSNFCGPQFVGMWRDVEWHQNLTAVIKNAPIEPELMNGRLWERL